MEDVKDVKKRVRDDSEETESGIDSPEVKRLREDLLDSLDDDPVLCTSNQDLDSFMKSFEEEIGGGCGVDVVDLVSESGDSRPDLGYLLGASDDELGIPPPPPDENELKTDLVRLDSFGGELWDGPGYDSFGFGVGEETYGYNGEYELDGLFDYSDLGFGLGDVSRRPETLPAQ